MIYSIIFTDWCETFWIFFPCVLSMQRGHFPHRFFWMCVVFVSGPFPLARIILLVTLFLCEDYKSNNILRISCSSRDQTYIVMLGFPHVLVLIVCINVCLSNLRGINFNYVTRLMWVLKRKIRNIILCKQYLCIDISSHTMND